jgi:hypothetical protein
VGSAATATRQRVHVTDWPSVPGRLPVTDDSIRRTLAIADPAVRNLWITQSYADLARRLLDVLDTDQTWCTFAIWASDTAGTSIRGQELPHVVSALLPGARHHVDAVVELAGEHTRTLRRFGLARRVAHRHVERVVAVAVQTVADRIAHGNTLVFAELAPLFVRFLDGLRTDPTGGPTPETLETWLDAIGVPGDGAEPHVRCAFRHYGLAVSAPPPQRAQHVLAANIAAVLHEQQRLQADIESSMDAGVLAVGDALAGAFHPLVPGAIRRRVVAAWTRDAEPHAERLWEHVVTRMLMRLSLPSGELHLDRDVPPLPDGHRFPGVLAVPSLPDLRALLGDWDGTAGTGVGAGARDWADLQQRMTYIVNLFRSRQRLVALTVPPFTTAQLAWMVRGEVPPNL